MKPEALAVKFFTLPDFSIFFNPSDYPNSPPPVGYFILKKISVPQLRQTLLAQEY